MKKNFLTIAIAFLLSAGCYAHEDKTAKTHAAEAKQAIEAAAAETPEANLSAFMPETPPPPARPALPSKPDKPAAPEKHERVFTSKTESSFIIKDGKYYSADGRELTEEEVEDVEKEIEEIFKMSEELGGKLNVSADTIRKRVELAMKNTNVDMKKATGWMVTNGEINKAMKDVDWKKIRKDVDDAMKVAEYEMKYSYNSDFIDNGNRQVHVFHYDSDMEKFKTNIEENRFDYIVEQINLDQSKREDFKKIYYDYRSENDKLIQEQKELGATKTGSDKEAADLLKKIDDNEGKQSKLRSAFHSRLNNVLTKEQQLKFRQAEQNYARGLLHTTPRVWKSDAHTFILGDRQEKRQVRSEDMKQRNEDMSRRRQEEHKARMKSRRDSGK